MKLVIWGSRHAGIDVENAVEDILSEIEEPEIIFTESRTDEFSWGEKTLHWVMSPFLLIGLTGWLRLLLPLLGYLFPGGRDVEIRDELVSEYDIPTKEVDIPIHKEIRRNWWLWLLGNWSLIFMPLYLFMINISITIFIFLTFSVLFVICGIMFVFLAGFNEKRELHMFKRISEVVSDKSYNEGVLITGGEHADRIHKLAELSEDIDPILAND